MSDPITIDTPRSPRRRHVRRHIEIDGDVLVPRSEFAADILGVSDKTAQRLNLPTTYVANVAYVAREASLKIIGEHVRRRNQPPHRRRGRRRHA